MAILFECNIPRRLLCFLPLRYTHSMVLWLSPPRALNLHSSPLHKLTNIKAKDYQRQAPSSVRQAIKSLLSSWIVYTVYFFCYSVPTGGGKSIYGDNYHLCYTANSSYRLFTCCYPTIWRKKTVWGNSWQYYYHKSSVIPRELIINDRWLNWK